ncbi:MAG: hypothetical protein HY751_05605 [Nitrospinae bacterium]|nr:hypothetical protein [Nitrospinota bacterium]
MTAPKHDSHAPRKLFHALAASIIPALYHLEVLPRGVIVAAVTLLAVLWIWVDSARLKLPRFNTWVMARFSFLMKKKEAHSVSGVSYLLGGTAIALLLFPPAVAVSTLFFIALGDPAAAVIGKRFGTIKLLHGRSLQGSLAMLAVCLVVARFIGGFAWPVSIAGALVATLAELYSGRIDDNLMVPILAGATMVSFG